MHRRATALALALGLASSDASAWWTLAGSVHGAIAEAALSDPNCAEFISYLGLDPSAIAAYAQEREPWNGDWRTHVTFWSMVEADTSGIRYVNDLGYVGASHDRVGSWPGVRDRSVDVIGAVLHSAGDCAVIMGHSPGNDWYSNDLYEAVFEGAGNARSSASWDPPSLPFIGPPWERWVYAGEPASEAHGLYLDTHASFVFWDTTVPEIQKTLGGSLLEDAAERAVRTGKRFTQAALRDFLSAWVLRPPSASISCNEVPGRRFTVNSGSTLTFRYALDGDRQDAAISVGPAEIPLPTSPMALASAGDTESVTLDTAGSVQARITAHHGFFGMDETATDAVDILVVPRPAASVRLDADDDDGDTIPDYDLLSETTPSIHEESTGTIEHRTVEVRLDGDLLGSWEDTLLVPWPFDDPGLYEISTTVSNSHFGPSTDTVMVTLEVVSGFPEPDDADSDDVADATGDPRQDAGSAGGCGCSIVA